jgi:diguanylate cyclase (GGDEF)-like protein/PAS domain S-box-containing protein
MKPNEDVSLIENLFEGVYIVNKERTITSWNEGAQQITGFSAQEVVNRHCYDNILNHVDEHGVALCFSGCPLHATIEDGALRSAIVYLQHKDGHRLPVKIKAIPMLNAQGDIDGAIEIFTEVQSEKALQTHLDQLKKEASEDALTGVANRKYMQAIIESKIREYKTVGVPFGLSFIDIDNFKRVNDTYGHEIGDEILKLMVKTVSSSLRKHDRIGRWGGEEFIILLTDIDQDGLALVSEKIRQLVENSKLRLPEQELSVTISMGSSKVCEDDTVDSLVQRCDQLMYQSKKTGKNKVSLG